MLPEVYTGSVTALSGEYESDLEVGAGLRAAAESLQWALGDYVNSMQVRYGESQRSLSQDISARTGVSTKTLQEYAKVAKVFSPSERSDTLTFSHFNRAAVAANPVQVIQQAEEDGLSVRDTERLAKGLPTGGEATAQQQSSTPTQGSSLEEAALEDLRAAAALAARALDTISKPGFRLTVPVGQDLQARLRDLSEPFLAIEKLVDDEIGGLG